MLQVVAFASVTRATGFSLLFYGYEWLRRPLLSHRHGSTTSLPYVTRYRGFRIRLAIARRLSVARAPASVPHRAAGEFFMLDAIEPMWDLQCTLYKVKVRHASRAEFTTRDNG